MNQLILTQEQCAAVDDLSRSRTDGGLGVIYDGTHYLCADVRNDPAYAEYHAILADCPPYCEPIDAWQGRYILAGMSPIAEGPLAAYPGANVLEQINAFVAASLTAPDQERFKGAKTWRREDPMIATFATLLGLDDAAIDVWFASARAIA